MEGVSADADLRRAFETEGRFWLRGLFDEAEVEALRAFAADDARPGARIDAAHPLFQAVARSALSQRLAAIWPGMRPVRLVAFNKTETVNWGVPWHQDRVIAVRERAEAPGFGQWSQKAGAWHCEPPTELLRQMIFTRIHLDDSTVENGAMEIAPGSHRFGLVAAEDAARIAGEHAAEPTIGQAGDVLALSMLTLHRSGKSVSDAPRRALRVDYAAEDLPPPLNWAV